MARHQSQHSAPDRPHPLYYSRLRCVVGNGSPHVSSAIHRSRSIQEWCLLVLTRLYVACEWMYFVGRGCPHGSTPDSRDHGEAFELPSVCPAAIISFIISNLTLRSSIASLLITGTRTSCLLSVPDCIIPHVCSRRRFPTRHGVLEHVACAGVAVT